MTESMLIEAPAMPQARPRQFQITTFNRFGHDPIELHFCDAHGVQACAEYQIRMDAETHIRQLVREVRRPWGRIVIRAWPLAAGQVALCDRCEADAEELEQ